MQTRVRFYGSLADLADDVEVEVAVHRPRSAKDLIESVGVPHPEVALIIADGEPIGLTTLVHGGERLAVYPPLRTLDLDERVTVSPPPIAPRFVADVHLGTLARRLRLLGLDTWYRRDTDDDELADVSVAERRILLTRDRGLLMQRVITHGYCPRSDDPEHQFDEVVERYDLVDHLAPMSRCVACNAALRKATAGEVEELVPFRSRRAFDRFSRCTGCGKVYWPGSHLRSLQRIVAGATAVDPFDDDPAGRS